MTLLTVGLRPRYHDAPTLSFAHSHETLIPTAEHLIAAQREAEWLRSGVEGGAKDLAGGYQLPNVVNLHRRTLDRLAWAFYGHMCRVH